MGSSLRDIALPEPVEQQEEIEEEIAHWAASPHDLQSFESSLTSDQVRAPVSVIVSEMLITSFSESSMMTSA
jgi:hypothetical protein